MVILNCKVFGTPIPQGSLKAFMPKGRRFPVMTGDNPRTRPWKYTVTMEARRGGPAVPSKEPIRLYLEFYLPKPKSTPRRVTEPTKKPDLDKLVRAIKDALTAAGVYRDDSQVVSLHARKFYANAAAGVVPHVDIKVEEIEEIA